MKKIIWCCLLLVSLGLYLALPSLAADCKSLKKGLELERNVKKKRQMLKDLIVECPDDPTINYKYALSLERFRKYDEALVYYQRVAKLNPKMGKAFVGMGDIHIYRGELDNAIDAYSIAKQLMPQSERTVTRLARLEIKRKALAGGMLTAGEFIQVMNHRGKVSSNTSLLLTGPALQYKIAFLESANQLLPTGIRQLAAIGQAMQSDALQAVHFEIKTYVNSGYPSSAEALKTSKERVLMIKDQLVENFSIEPDRIIIKWYGDKQPLEIESASGRQFVNSRVEFKRLYK